MSYKHKSFLLVGHRLAKKLVVQIEGKSWKEMIRRGKTLRIFSKRPPRHASRWAHAKGQGQGLRGLLDRDPEVAWALRTAR